MRTLVLLAALIAACQQPTAPKQFVLGPGCWHEREIIAPGVPTLTLKLHYPDCTKHNVDSLQTAGWRIVWDTTWPNQ